MKAFYKQLPKGESVVYSDSATPRVNTYQKVFRDCCRLLGVSDSRGVGRASFKDLDARDQAEDISKKWLAMQDEEDLQCKFQRNSSLK